MVKVLDRIEVQYNGAYTKRLVLIIENDLATRAMPLTRGQIQMQWFEFRRSEVLYEHGNRQCSMLLTV